MHVADNKVETVFAPIQDKISNVWEYLGGTTDPWKHFRPGLEQYSDLKTVSAGHVYYLDLKSPAGLVLEGAAYTTPASLDFSAGWNSLVWTYPAAKPILDALPGLTFGVDYDAVARFNNQTKQWEYFRDSGSDDFSQFEPGQVYFIHMLIPKTATVSAPVYSVTRTKYIYHNNQRLAKQENGVKYFYLSDHLGSTAVVADGSGAEVGRYEYQPYGGIKSQSGTDISHYKFTGKELDDSTGLYDYAARQYDAGLGRFISPDPLNWVGKDFETLTNKKLPDFLANPQNLNRYAYCLNNPIKYVDKTGLWVELGTREVIQNGIKTGGYHTVTILHPDNPDNFKNDSNYANRFYTNTKGELEATLSANPNGKPNWKSLFGNLVATPNNAGDRPENMQHRQRLRDHRADVTGSDRRDDTQLIKDFFASADKYANDLPYDPTPVPNAGYYNSNSYTYGVSKDVGITLPNLAGWEPGANIPIPLNKRRQ